MAHKLINDKVVVDWTAGDPEGDRVNLLSAYKDFVEELVYFINQDIYMPEGTRYDLQKILKRWSISTDNQVDEIPRIWIKRPE